MYKITLISKGQQFNLLFWLYVKHTFLLKLEKQETLTNPCAAITECLPCARCVSVQLTRLLFCYSFYPPPPHTHTSFHTWANAFSGRLDHCGVLPRMIINHVFMSLLCRPVTASRWHSRPHGTKKIKHNKTWGSNLPESVDGLASWGQWKPHTI